MNLYILLGLIREMRRRLSQPIVEPAEQQQQQQSVIELADWQRGGCLFQLLHKLFRLVDRVRTESSIDKLCQS
jgi:hypothetical protein